jgi:hypothetical protein
VVRAELEAEVEGDAGQAGLSLRRGCFVIILKVGFFFGDEGVLRIDVSYCHALSELESEDEEHMDSLDSELVDVRLLVVGAAGAVSQQKMAARKAILWVFGSAVGWAVWMNIED